MPRPITPLIAADTIIELENQPGDPIVLIERRFPPTGWAIPGGFVDVGESMEQAAIREAREETCLDVSLVFLLGLYSDPKRDPRGHTVTAVYIAKANGIPKGADDAKSTRIVAPDDLPAELVFDHALVLHDYRVYRKTSQPAPIRYV